MKALAALFVVIWSSGFIVARAIVSVADPMPFLALRFALAAALFLAIAIVARARWPRWRDMSLHVVAGMLLQGGYVTGTWWAVANGLAPGVMALLGALQPLLTALVAIPILREWPSRRTWIGLLLGFGGVALVLAPRLTARGGDGLSLHVVVIAILAVLSLTLGTVLQKTSIARADIRASSVLQNCGAAIVAGVLIGVLGESRLSWGFNLWASLGWATLVLSGVGTLLLVWMVRRGRAANVASLMLLAPPLAAVESHLLFGEQLSAIQIVGFAIALAGVALCQPGRAVEPPPESPEPAAPPAAQ